MRSFRSRTTVCAGLTALLLGVPSVAPAGAATPPRASATVRCGQTITKSTTLVADVGPCAGDGIIVGGDNIRLNLNGHTVFGTPGPGDGSAAGIRLMNRSRVTVTGRPGNSGNTGTVTGFDAGIAVYRGSGNTIENLVVRDNVGPESDQSELGDGIALFNSANNRIINNSVVRNGTYDGISALGPGTDNNLFQGNLVEENIGFGGCCNPGSGIILSNFFQPDDPQRGDSIYGNRVVNNVVRRNFTAGITTVSNVRGEIIGNLVEDNGTLFKSFANGIGVSRGDMSVLANGSLVKGNRVFRNGYSGIMLDRAVQEVTVTENEVAGNLLGIATGNNASNNFITSNSALDDLAFDLADASDEENGYASCPNTWRNNTYLSAFPDCVMQQNPPMNSSSADDNEPASTPPDASRRKLPKSQDAPSGRGRRLGPG